MPSILQQLRSRQKTLQSLRAKGTAQPLPYLARNYALPFRKDAASYADSAGGILPSSIDDKTRSAEFVICTLNMDREGDVVDPPGCLGTIDNYKANPVVFFDHYQKEVLPVGTADRSGKLHVKVYDDKVTARAFFHDVTPMARDVWELVRRGVLRATSVGFAPLAAEKIRTAKAHGRGEGGVTMPRYHFKEWDLLEFSICGVPVNPEALRMEMSAGRITDDRLRHCLKSYLPVAKVWANGFGVEAMATRTKTRRTKKADSIDQTSKSRKGRTRRKMEDQEHEELKAKGKKAEDEEEEPDASTEDDMEYVREDDTSDISDLTEGPDDLGDVDPDADVDALEGDEVADGDMAAEDEDLLGEETDDLGLDDEPAPEEAAPMGASTLADICAHDEGCRKYIESMLPQNEKPEVQAYLEQRLEEQAKTVSEIREMAEKLYPEVDFEGLMNNGNDAGDDLGLDLDEEKAEGLNEGVGSEGGYVLDEDEDEEKSVDKCDDDEDYPKSKGKRKAVNKGGRRLTKAHKNCIKEATEFMDDMSEDDRVPKGYKSGLRFHSRELTEMVEKDMGPDEVGPDEPGDEVYKSVAAGVNRLADVFGVN